MLTQDPVKIPEIPKKIRFKEKDGTSYVQYLEERKYDSDKKHNVPNWVNIGKKIEGLYHEFKQQTRKNADLYINGYKADSINKVLLPLKEMMQGEPYAELLGLISSIEYGEEGMTYSDAMILLT